MKYYEKELSEKFNIVGLALSSRKNMCVHPDVGTLSCYHRSHIHLPHVLSIFLLIQIDTVLIAVQEDVRFTKNWKERKQFPEYFFGQLLSCFPFHVIMTFEL